jgi:DNA-directed RNA polymerase subunit RPC12/RpoP
MLEMPKPETVSRLCTKCHSKTVHEVRERTVAGTKLVCTDCGHSLVVTSM